MVLSEVDMVPRSGAMGSIPSPGKMCPTVIYKIQPIESGSVIKSTWL